MIVCGHGDVSEYCESHDMIVMDRYDGNIEDYRGVCPVLVTDQDMSETEYFFQKGRLLAHGIELISTRHDDNKLMAEYAILALEKAKESRKEKTGGRCKFGFCRVDGAIVPNEKEMKVVRKIIELRDAGLTYRKIQANEEVRHPNGSQLSISTIQTIYLNRESYEV